MNAASAGEAPGDLHDHTLLVVGATGPTGRLVVTQAAARGAAVIALSRRPDAGLEGRSGVRVALGDVLRPATIDQTVAGCDAVISVLGSALTLRPITLLSEGTRNLIAAMTRADVKRLICVTGIGAGESRGHGGFLYDRLILPLLLRQVYADKDRQEDMVRASGLDWTIVRPAQLTNKPPKGRVRAFVDLDGVTAGTIARADVATFLLDEVARPQFLRAAPLITT